MQAPTAPAGDHATSCAAAVDTDLGWALGMVFRSYIKAADHVIAGLPGGPRGYQLLTIAARALPATQLAIAQQLGVDRTVMTYLLDDLEEEGLVERKPDPSDRRARRIVATDKGHARLAELQQGLRLAEDHVLAALDESKRDEFRSMVRSIATQAGAQDPASDPCLVAADIEIAEKATAPARSRRGRRTAAPR